MPEETFLPIFLPSTVAKNTLRRCSLADFLFFPLDLKKGKFYQSRVIN